jgi:predicted O-linked N-acetylglucosamine transferase (SPINDLY family)
LYDPEQTRESLRLEFEKWGARTHAGCTGYPVSCARLPRKRLRIGYLSGEFATTPSRHFLLPIVRNHDRVPSYAHGYYKRDNAYYKAWDAISRDRDTFLAWMKTNVLEQGPEAFAVHCSRLRAAAE